VTGTTLKAGEWPEGQAVFKDFYMYEQWFFGGMEEVSSLYYSTTTMQLVSCGSIVSVACSYTVRSCMCDNVTS
jgi:hypothetical protein